MSQLSYMEKLLDGVEVEWKLLGEVYKFQYGMGNTIPTTGGEYPVYGSNGIVGTHNEFNSEDSPVIGHIGAYAGIVNWGKGKHFVTYNGVICKLISKFVNSRYAYHFLLKQDFNSIAKSASHPFISYAELNKVLIPIPCPDNPEKSLAIQAEIVRILDAFTAMTTELTTELSLRKKQYNYYRDQLLSFDLSADQAGEGDVEWKRLEEIGHIVTGRTPKSSDKSAWGDDVDFVTPSDIKNGMRNITCPSRRLSAEGAASMPKVRIPSGSLLVTCIGADMGKTVINANDCIPNQQINAITLTDDNVQVGYLFHVLTAMRETLRRQGELGGGTMPLINKSDFSKIVVPVPSYEEQNRIATILDKFDALTNSITEGLPREIELRQKQYEYYRDLLLSFPASPAGGPKSHSDEAA